MNRCRKRVRPLLGAKQPFEEVGGGPEGYVVKPPATYGPARLSDADSEQSGLRLRSLFRRRDLEAELEAELRFHLEQLVEENISAGMSPDEARRAAMLMIGSIALQGGVPGHAPSEVR